MAKRKEPLSDDDKIIGLHNTSSEKLAKADKLGGFAVPSLALTKIKHGLAGFGDTSLIAPPSLITPGKGNPVFGSDVYSPRFPSLNDEGTKIFRGFTDMGNRRYKPLTLDNVVREMKGKVRGEEGHNYGAGSVRAMVTQKFSNMNAIDKARHKLLSKQEFEPLKKVMNDHLSDLAEKFQPYSKYFGTPTQHHFAFPDILAEVATKGPWSLKEHYNDTLPPEHVKEVGAFLGLLRDMPTEYFEAKPQRGVGIHEFAGAIVPGKQMDKVGPILDKHGIKRIESYGGYGDDAGRQAALRKFSDLGFHAGGNAKLQKASGGSVNHNPTDGQKAAGNYAKERVSFQGIPVSIENKKGSLRSGVDEATGKRWSARLPADYGYIRGTVGADRDHVDCYIGPKPDSNIVVVINQRDHRSGKFDEHKCMLGYDNERAAVEDYKAAFSDGRGQHRIGSVECMSIDAFKRWLKSGKNTKPAYSRAIVDRALAFKGA